MTQERENKRSLVGVTAGVLVGMLVVVAGSIESVKVGPFTLFAIAGLLAYGINWVAFIPANRAKTEHYFDLTGSLTYLIVIAAAVTLSGNLDARSVIVSTMVALWALRLGSFLFWRVRMQGRDGRFDEIKIDPLRFFMTWTLQGLWVLLTLAAALAIITGTERKQLGWVAGIGIVIWLVGFVIEVVADQQKSRFKEDKENEGRFITSGLWAWSRHPNYFGEITLWTGVAILAIPVLSGWGWAMLVSPVFVAILLTKGSGIPLLEARAEARWGEEEAFQQYTDRTPVLVPRRPRVH